MPCNRVCSGVLTTNRMSSTITTSRQHWRLAGKRKWDVTEYDHWCSRSRGQEAHRLKNTRIRSLAASWLVRVAWFGTVLAWLNSKHSNFYLLFSSSGSVIDYSSFLSFFSLDSRWNFESATCFLPPKLNLFWCFAGFWFDSVDSFPVLAELVDVNRLTCSLILDFYWILFPLEELRSRKWIVCISTGCFDMISGVSLVVTWCFFGEKI